MAEYQVAHIREQGVDLIIIPLNWSFGSKSLSEQKEIIAALQMCAKSAGLAGTVVPVWQSGSHVQFIAPQNWHLFFKSISYEFVLNNINRKLICREERVAMRSSFEAPIRTAKPEETTQLDEAILCATSEALKSEAPDLVQHIDAIASQKPVWSGGHEIGQSMYDRYEVKLPKTTLDSIISALRKIEATHGFNKIFADRQINLLVLLWSRIAPFENQVAIQNFPSQVR